MSEFCTTTYKKDFFEKELQKEFDKQNVEYSTTGCGYIDGDYSTIFDCIVKAFETTTESKMLNGMKMKLS